MIIVKGEERKLKDKVRAYHLQNGDIFQSLDKHYQYENMFFYEVVEDENDEFGQTKWKRTGVVLTGEELNQLVSH